MSHLLTFANKFIDFAVVMYLYYNLTILFVHSHQTKYNVMWPC